MNTDKGKFFILNYVVKPVMILVFIPLVLVVDNMHIDITAILEIERSKLGLFANKGTISKTLLLKVGDAQYEPERSWQQKEPHPSFCRTTYTY